MPLVVLCGRPCVGKTTLATALAAYLRAHHSGDAGAVTVISDETLGIDKAEGYKSAWLR